MSLTYEDEAIELAQEWLAEINDNPAILKDEQLTIEWMVKAMNAAYEKGYDEGYGEGESEKEAELDPGVESMYLYLSLDDGSMVKSETLDEERRDDSEYWDVYDITDIANPKVYYDGEWHDLEDLD